VSGKLEYNQRYNYTADEKLVIGTRKVSPECTIAISSLHDEFVEKNRGKLYIIKPEFRSISRTHSFDLLLGDETHAHSYTLKYSNDASEYVALEDDN